MTAAGLVNLCALGALAALAGPLLGCAGDTERDGRPSAGGQADQQAEWTTYEDARRGYSVRFPASWHRAATPVSPKLTEPREIFAVATFRHSRHRPTDCEAFAGSARSQMGPGDVLLTVQERGHDRESEAPGFPDRPESFAPRDPESGEPGEHACGDPPGTTTYWRDFADAGRRFHTLVVIGPDTPAHARTQVWGILDSLRFDPDRRPTWPASE